MEYEFELLGEAEDQLRLLVQALADRPSKKPGLPTAQMIYDLSIYSDRIVGIGEEKPYASPYIAKKQEDAGWFPDNLASLIELPPLTPGEYSRYVSLDEGVLVTLEKGNHESKGVDLARRFRYRVS